MSDPQRLQLQKKSEELKSQLASSRIADSSALQTQLTAVQGRLEKIETEGKVAETLSERYEPSVCLIHVVLAFADHTTGSTLRYAGVTSSGEPTTDEHNNPLVSLTGTGPEVTLTCLVPAFLFLPADRFSPIITWPNRGGRMTI